MLNEESKELINKISRLCFKKFNYCIGNKYISILPEDDFLKEFAVFCKEIKKFKNEDLIYSFYQEIVMSISLTNDSSYKNIVDLYADDYEIMSYLKDFYSMTTLVVLKMLNSNSLSFKKMDEALIINNDFKKNKIKSAELSEIIMNEPKFKNLYTSINHIMSFGRKMAQIEGVDFDFIISTFQKNNIKRDYMFLSDDYWACVKNDKTQIFKVYKDLLYGNSIYNLQKDSRVELAEIEKEYLIKWMLKNIDIKIIESVDLKKIYYENHVVEMKSVINDVKSLKRENVLSEMIVEDKSVKKSKIKI